MKHYQTEQRQKLLHLFEASAHSTLSASQIFNKFGREGISMSAIYRNLKEMEMRGVIHKVIEKDCPETLYQYVNPQTCKGVIHLKCQDCQNTYHLDREISQTVALAAQDSFGFSLSTPAAFLYGQCQSCSQASKNRKVKQ